MSTEQWRIQFCVLFHQRHDKQSPILPPRRKRTAGKRGSRGKQHGEQGHVGSSVVVFKETTNSEATVSGLCPLLHQQELPSRPPGRAIEHDDTASETYASFQGCNNVRRIALYRARGPLPYPMGPLANSSLHQPYPPQGSGYDWLLSSSAHDKRVSHPGRTSLLHFVRTKCTIIFRWSFRCTVMVLPGLLFCVLYIGNSSRTVLTFPRDWSFSQQP